MSLAENDLQALLHTGIQAARAGNKQVAQRIFEQVLEADDRNELAWMWMASVVDTAGERRICLENALALNPQNERARQAMERLRRRKPKAPPSRKPIPSPEKADLDAEPSQAPVAEPAPPGAPPTEPPLAVTPSRRRQRRLRQVFVLTMGAVGIIVVVAVTVLLLQQRDGLTLLGRAQQTAPPPTPMPTRVELVTPGGATPIPTWSPFPTPTPPPSRTPTPTLVPLSNYVLAYSALADRQRNENIYIIWANGDEDTQVQITDDETRDLDPEISPDGSRIAFVSDRTGNPELHLISIDGGDATQLTALGASELEAPSWSPDGGKIVFSANADGDHEIYIVRLDAPLEPLQLTDNQATDREPAWSPDGETIAFASDRIGRGYLQVFTVAADCNERFGGCEGHVYQLTRSQNSSMSPAWSPDGQYIVFVSNRVSTDDEDIYIMRADGTDARLLTLDQYGDNGASDMNPSWSRDGLWIAFSSDREGPGFQIYVISTDGTRIFQVTSQSGNALSPSWSP
jgi:Tol biopolymer transport system component